MESTKKLEKIAKKIIKGSKKKFFADLTADERAELKKILISMRRPKTFTSRDIKSMANAIVAGNSIPTDLPTDVRDAVLLTAEAIKYLDGIVNKDGNGNVEVGKSIFVSERLRPDILVQKFLQIEESSYRLKEVNLTELPLQYLLRTQFALVILLLTREIVDMQHLL